MTTAFDLIGRELLMLGTLSLFGAAAAMLLPSHWRGPVRICLAPVLGMCVGVCVFTTLVWLVPASKGKWAVPVLAIASLITAIWLRRREHRGSDEPIRRPPMPIVVAQVALVAAAVAGPLTYSFVVRSSLGPVGYQVGDSQGYVAEIDGMSHNSLRQAAALSGSPAYAANVAQRYWSDFSVNDQQLDVTAVFANVGGLFGFSGTEIESAFLIAVLLAGALGIYASVSATLGRVSWLAALGGGFFGGAMFLQLFFDGSEAAISGLSAIVPLGLLVTNAIQKPSGRSVLCASIVAAGLVDLYPLFVPAASVGIAALLALHAFRSARQRTHISGQNRSHVAWLVAAVVLTFALDPVAAGRAIRYWLQVLHGGFVGGGLPNYGFLTPSTVPAWLLQLRPFYDIYAGGPKSFQRSILEFVLPLLLACVALTGLRRRASTWYFIGLIAAAASFGGYERVAHSCSYCEDRNLLPIAPVAIALFAIGLGTMLAARSRALRVTAAIAALAAGVGIARGGYTSITLFRNNAYFLDSGDRLALNHLPAGATVELEGFGEGELPAPEQGLVYMLAEERAWGRVSLPDDFNENGSLLYLGGGGYLLNEPQFKPRYGYVLTRYPAVLTDRKTIVSYEGVALEERVRQLDVTPDFGLWVPPERQDSAGLASPNPYIPGGEVLKVIVTGSPRLPLTNVYVNLGFRVLAGKPQVSSLGPGVFKSRMSGNVLDVCVQATGASPALTANLKIEPTNNIELTSMTASVGRCDARP